MPTRETCDHDSLPWTVTLTHLLMPDTQLLDYHCTDYDVEAVEQ